MAFHWESGPALTTGATFTITLPVQCSAGVNPRSEGILDGLRPVAQTA